MTVTAQTPHTHQATHPSKRQAHLIATLHELNHGIRKRWEGFVQIALKLKGPSVFQASNCHASGASAASTQFPRLDRGLQFSSPFILFPADPGKRLYLWDNFIIKNPQNLKNAHLPPPSTSPLPATCPKPSPQPKKTQA